MTEIKGKVKEALLGPAEEPSTSQITSSSFLRHALQDEATGQLYLDEKSFVDAIAPEKEDYVGQQVHLLRRIRFVTNAFVAASTKSRDRSMLYCSGSQIADAPEELVKQIGMRSKLFLPNLMRSMRSRFDYLMSRALESSGSKIFRNNTMRIKVKKAFPSIGTQGGQHCTLAGGSRDTT
jgi:hypothetical protein